MHPKIIIALKIAATMLIGMSVVILLSSNKIASSIVLMVTAVIILLPAGKNKWLKWGRVAFLLAAIVFVLWNISTTEYRASCYDTGIKFFDQVLRIFDGFLQNVFNRSIANPGCHPTRPELY